MEIIPALPSINVDLPLDGQLPYLGSLDSNSQVLSEDFSLPLQPSYGGHAGPEMPQPFTRADFPVWDATQEQQGRCISSLMATYLWADRYHLFA